MIVPINQPKAQINFLSDPSFVLKALATAEALGIPVRNREAFVGFVCDVYNLGYGEGGNDTIQKFRATFQDLLK